MECVTEQLNVIQLDSIIDKSHPFFDNRDNIHNFRYDKETSEWKEIIHHNGPISQHGTAVASVIIKNCTRPVSIKCYEIIRNGYKDNVFLLKSALNFIANNENPGIINISVGTEYYDEELYETCDRLNRKGFILIAGFSNYGGISFPAAFESTIGVDVTASLTTYKEMIYVENSLINVGIMRGRMRVAWNHDWQILSGTSFVVPLVTLQVGYLYTPGDNTVTILKKLKETATRIITFPESIEASFPPHMEKVAVVPYNKEIANLVNNSNTCRYTIKEICDIRLMGNLGKKIKVGENIIEIRNINNIRWDEIDGIIIGHVAEIEERLKKEIKFHLIQQAIKHKKKVLCLDDRGLPSEIMDNLDVYSWKANINKYNAYKFGKMYSIQAPVLCVAGTSSSQGKFTLQMKLRKRFADDGYNTFQLVTEPIGDALIDSFTYPYGYLQNTKLQGAEQVEYVNALMYEIDRKHPDVIITGCQSGSAVIDFSNIRSYNNATYEFLQGVNPDGMILCINFHDPEESVVRTYKFLEGAVDGKVIAIVMFSFDYLTESDYSQAIKKTICCADIEKRKQRLKQLLGLNTYIIDDEGDIEKLYQECIDFYTEV